MICSRGFALGSWGGGGGGGVGSTGRLYCSSLIGGNIEEISEKNNSNSASCMSFCMLYVDFHYSCFYCFQVYFVLERPRHQV
jgi:hypothetical protein